MKQTDYAGIDYGMGKANVDNETGIRYGVIGQNSETLNQNAVQDVWQNGKDLGFEAFRDTIRGNLERALRDYLSQTAVLEAFEAIEDYLGDAYGSNGESGPMLYERDGYVIKTSESELWVLKSPYFTHAQFCSPCAPGAGNLDTACPDGPKTYCLGPEWFEEDKAPYPVLNVSDLKAA